MDKCPNCGFVEAVPQKRITNVMNRYVNQNGLLAIFNDDKNEFTVGDVKWTREDKVPAKKAAAPVPASVPATPVTPTTK